MQEQKKSSRIADIRTVTVKFMKATVTYHKKSPSVNGNHSSLPVEHEVIYGANSVSSLDPAEDVKSVADLATFHFSSDLTVTGIQVTPPRFRLRFVPHLRWRCTPRGLCLISVQVFTSQIGLGVFLLVWTLLGAAAFHATEGAREASLERELRVIESRLASDMAKELHQVPAEQHWRVLEHGVRLQEQALSAALNAGYSANGGTVWNFAGSLLFAVTMLTTIGFGAPVPRSPLGRTSAIIYSAVSIPLNLLLVVNFGALVADKLETCIRQSRQQKRHRKDDKTLGLDFLPPPTWFTWLPIFAIIAYYLFGVALFGGVPLFPLEFTTAGDVGQRSSLQRAVYAVYLEFAVILAGISVNVWRNTASSGFITLGLKLDLLSRGDDNS